MRWNLDDIYTGFDSPAFAADVKKLDELIEGLNAWSRDLGASDATATLAEAVRRFGEYKSLMERTAGYSYLRMSVEAENPDAQAWIERLSVKDAGVVEAIVRFRKYLSGLGAALDETVAAHPELGEFGFFFRENQEQARYMLSDEVEKALSLMEITGSQAWSNLHNTLTSTLTAEMEQSGEKKQLTLSMVRNLAYDSDRDVRRRAYDAELASYPKVEKAVAAALNGIKGEVLTKCRMRGFASPLEQTLFNSRMDRATLDAMLGAMEEYLPMFRRYLRAKAKLLGYEGGLPFWELFAPVGGEERRFTLEESRDYLVNNFRAFSDKMADFIDNAYEKEWMDTEPREGKQGGAFCAGVHAIGQSRVLANFDGSFNAVRTLAHELGHGYHGHCLKHANMLNTDYPMPLAETASIFNETFILNKALEEAGSDAERLGLLEEQLMEATQVVVDILSRYYFESSVFARREEGALSAEDCKNLMLDAQKRSYGDGLDENQLHPYMWLCKGHYYMGINFYNFPYAFGLLFGLGVYGIYREQGSAFLPKYDALLAATGCGTIADVCASVGIDVRDRAFWRKSLDVIAANAERFAALAGAV